ncbi:hypothetical protein [Streptomyces sp. NPDC048252]|uniref:hypothetical protein n=1 Tax=Streptomyces sp. NPDC048252 TaxID=3154612 RepID=UPI00342B650A
MTTSPPTPSIRAADAAALLLTAHPHLTAVSVDTIDVPGPGQTVLIQTEGRTALQGWAHALDTTVRSTGRSSYGTTEPHLPDYPDWLWWRLLYLDTRPRPRPAVDARDLRPPPCPGRPPRRHHPHQQEDRP